MSEISPVPPSPTDWSFADRQTMATIQSKPARPDIIIESSSVVPIEIMTDLLFEDIGGEEILSMTRHDLVNGIAAQHQQISNLGKIAEQYNSLNIVPIEGALVDIFGEYPIQLHKFLPDGEHTVYIGENEAVYIELLETLGKAYKIEVEILPSDAPFNDTIYEEES